MSSHDDKTHAHEEHNEIAHPLPVWLLVAVWGALMVFTVLTVWVASLGLGSQMSFTAAMIIATLKAALVILVFMHLWWDKRMNLFAFLGAFLFVMLFIGMLLTDKSEYAPDIKRKLADDAAKAG